MRNPFVALPSLPTYLNRKYLRRTMAMITIPDAVTLDTRVLLVFWTLEFLESGVSGSNTDHKCVALVEPQSSSIGHLEPLRLHKLYLLAVKEVC